MDDYHDTAGQGMLPWINRAASRLAVCGLLAAAILDAQPAQASWQAEQMARQCESAGGHYDRGRCLMPESDPLSGTVLGLLLNNLTQDPAGKTATFLGTYHLICSSKRFGPCPHNVEEWERRHGER